MRKVLMVLFAFMFVSLVSANGLSPSENTDVIVTVDGEAPLIIIYEPQNITYNNATPILVNYTIIEQSLDSAWYWLNNSNNITINGSFFLEIPEGNYQLRIYANDTLGRVNFTDVNFTVDNSILACGDLICTLGLEDCSSCFVDCGVCPAPPSQEETLGGGSGGGTSSIADFELDKKIIELEIFQGQTKEEDIVIENTGQRDLKITLVPDLIDNFISLNGYEFFLPWKESRDIIVKVSADENDLPDSYIGKIIAKGSNIEREINFVIDVKERGPLFDITTELEKSVINQGSNVVSSIKIFNLGVENINAILEYSIKDFKGNTILIKEESVFIEKELDLVRSFSSLDIPPGNYVFYTKISYGNIVATSSQAFEIRKGSFYTNYFYITLFVIIALFVIILGRSRKKKR
jgi:hypothetical protein